VPGYICRRGRAGMCCEMGLEGLSRSALAAPIERQLPEPDEGEEPRFCDARVP
jgi:hypothetical protein